MIREMAARDWNEQYVRGELPWDSDEPDPHLVDLVRAGTIAPGRALEVGSGTGTNALWLATQGFDVLGIDVSIRAVEMADAKAGRDAPRVTFSLHDFLEDTLAGPFDFAFDPVAINGTDSDCSVSDPVGGVMIPPTACFTVSVVAVTRTGNSMSTFLSVALLLRVRVA